jgi:NAD(P)H-flavin reductase
LLLQVCCAEQGSRIYFTYEKEARTGKMSNQWDTFTVQAVREETAEMRLLSVSGQKVWSFITGQVAVLGINGVGESYFAIASAPEDKGGMDFLIRKGKGVSEALFGLGRGDRLQGRGPIGKGFPIDEYRGRDFMLAAVGSAISPIRSVLRSICRRRTDFGRVALIYGARHPQDFAFRPEMEDWRKSDVHIVLTVSRPEGYDWVGRTGHVQSHFREVLPELRQPVSMICGMEAMMGQSTEELIRLGVASTDILTNI